MKNWLIALLLLAVAGVGNGAQLRDEQKLLSLTVAENGRRFDVSVGERIEFTVIVIGPFWKVWGSTDFVVRNSV